MEIKLVESQPYEKSIFPSLKFNVEIGYERYQEAIVGVNGWIETNDGKIIAKISEIPEEDLKILDIMAKNSDYDSRFESCMYKISFLSLLNKKSLDYIEKRRTETKKGDVELRLCLRVRFIKNNATLFHSKLVDPKELGLNVSNLSDRDEIVTYTYDMPFSPRKNDCWIISGKENPTFLSVRERKLEKDLRIPSSDWIHDYLPRLGFNEYFIIEIPKENKIIGEAWDYIEKAEESFRRLSTKGVYIHCREAGSLLNRTMKENFDKKSFVYKERWGRAYSNFSNITSLDLHSEDIKGSKYSSEEIDINGADADYILIITKALIKYAEALLTENEEKKLGSDSHD